MISHELKNTLNTKGRSAEQIFDIKSVFGTGLHSTVKSPDSVYSPIKTDIKP